MSQRESILRQDYLRVIHESFVAHLLVASSRSSSTEKGRYDHKSIKAIQIFLP
jgi:hypothetical protein